jgi:transposase
MATVDAQVEANLEPFRTAVELIMSIPGIKNLSAHVIVSEIGMDMSRFSSAAHSSRGLAYVRVMMKAPANVKGANWLRGPKKAIMAVVASIPTAICHMLKGRHDVSGPRLRPFQAPHHPPAKNRLVNRLSDLGFSVELKPLAA